MSDSFRGDNHYLVVGEVRDTLSLSKRGAQDFDMERFNLKKLNDIRMSKSRFKTSCMLEIWITWMMMMMTMMWT
jgi:hypothetical protein